MYYVYILESVPTGRYYVGSTKDIEHRLRKHNAGHSAATKAYRPWRLVHQEEFQTRGDALRREYEIKRHKSRSYISSLRGWNACPAKREGREFPARWDPLRHNETQAVFFTGNGLFRFRLR